MKYVLEESDSVAAVSAVQLPPPVTRLPTHRRIRPPFGKNRNNNNNNNTYDNAAYDGDGLHLDAEEKIRQYDVSGAAAAAATATVTTTTTVADFKPEKPYDPYDVDDDDDDNDGENSTSFVGTTFHVLIIVAGPCVLSVPSPFVSVGYAVGLVLVPLLVYLYAYVASMMVWSEYELCKMKRVRNLSYPDVAYHAFDAGPEFGRCLAAWCRRLSYVVFVLVWFGACCYDYVIICDNMRVLVANTLRTQLPIDLFLIALLVPTMLLGWVPKLKYLVPFSVLGSLLNGLCLVLILYYVVSDPQPWRVPPAVGRLSDVPLLTGTVLFSLNMTGIMLSLKNEMRQPRRFGSCCGVLMLSFAVTSFVYTFFSFVCALKYGVATQASIIENLPQDHWPAQLGVLLSSLALLFQYPLVMYVPFDICWRQIAKRWPNTRPPIVWEYALRTTLVVLSFVVSLAVPNVFLFLSLSGTVGTSIDSLIIPASVHSIVVWKTCQNKTKFWLIFAKNMAIIALAVMLVVTGCHDCITQIIEYYSASK